MTRILRQLLKRGVSRLVFGTKFDGVLRRHARAGPGPAIADRLCREGLTPVRRQISAGNLPARIGLLEPGPAGEMMP